MIPYIIAGAIGYGIAKLVEKDNTEKFAKGGGVGSEIYMLLYDFVDEKMIEGDSVAESMINEKGYSLTYDELYNYVDEKMIEGDSDAENLLNRINSFKKGGETDNKFDDEDIAVYMCETEFGDDWFDGENYKDENVEAFYIAVHQYIKHLQNKLNLRNDETPLYEGNLDNEDKKFIKESLKETRYVSKNNHFKEGGVFRDFYEGQSIIVQQETSTKLDKSVKNLFNKFSNKELVIDKIEKNTPYNIAKVFDRNTGEKAPFDVILNPKYVEQYARGGRIDKMDKFISELAKKHTKEFSVNEYHDFRNKKYAIGVARHYFTDNDVSFSKFDTKLGDALNIDFETQGDSTFITLGINDLPQKYGVSEKWLDGKLKLINKPINNKTRNKLLSQLQERFMEDWENNLIGFAPNKKSIVWLEYDYDAQTGLEELNKDGEYVAKKGSKYEEFDNDIWDEYFSSIADDEDEN